MIFLKMKGFFEEFLLHIWILGTIINWDQGLSQKNTYLSTFCCKTLKCIYEFLANLRNYALLS